MLPLAQLNYLLRHSGANGAAGSADLKKHRFNASRIQQLDTGPGRRSWALPAAAQDST